MLNVKQISAKKFQLRHRATIAKMLDLNQHPKTKLKVARNPSITHLRKTVVSAVRYAVATTADEAYDYEAFSWRGTSAEENRRVDIYESDEHGHVTACLWQEYQDEDNMVSSHPVAVFSAVDIMATIAVINKWMYGVMSSKINEYIVAHVASFPDADLSDGILT